jgi:hypothetical protein
MMITKNKFWKKIREELKEVERSRKFTIEIMNIIKDIPQDENKESTT